MNMRKKDKWNFNMLSSYSNTLKAFLSLSISLSLSVFFSLFLTHIDTQTHTHTQASTHTKYLYYCLLSTHEMK